jgi:hypothetical protein
MILTKEHQSLAVLIALGVVGLYFASGYAAKKAAAVGNAVNPLNDKNIFYSGVNNVGGAVTGKTDFSLGVWIYDVFHDDEMLSTEAGGINHGAY